jgi:hypothetical protein
MDKLGYESGNSRQTEAPAPIKRSRIEMMDDGSPIPRIRSGTANLGRPKERS